MMAYGASAPYPIFVDNTGNTNTQLLITNSQPMSLQPTLFLDFQGKTPGQIGPHASTRNNGKVRLPISPPSWALTLTPRP